MDNLPIATIITIAVMAYDDGYADASENEGSLLALAKGLGVEELIDMMDEPEDDFGDYEVWEQ
jgi:hypothetical protein